MTDELLSVVIPIYNVEKYLPQCIDSVINQTYLNLEIILVDDGSTDSSGKIAEDYAMADKRIQVIHKDNGGLISARYTGVKNAHGEYIAFVDGDDWIALDMYKYLMGILRCYDVDLVTSGCFRYCSEEKKSVSYDRFITPGMYDRTQIHTKIVPIMLWDKRSNVWSLDPSTCFKIYKKNILFPILAKLKKEKFYYGEDSAITYSYILKINSMYCTNEIFYYHRQRLNHQVAPYFLADDYFEKISKLYYFLYNEFKQHTPEDILVKQLDYFFINSVRYKQLKYGMMVSVREDYYLFPFDQVKPDSRFIIYGAGRVGSDYMQQLGNLHYGELLLWVDKNYAEMNERISNPDEITSLQFDYIIIAIAQEKIAEEIRNWLLSKGVSNEKIIHRILKCRERMEKSHEK